jgi:CheY-like chemotaxis protein
MSLRLLVVDDDAQLLKLLKNLLESLGYEVLALSDSREAAQRVAQQKFDSIFVDAYMPDVDGFELTRRIRESPSNASVPVIMLTGFDDVRTMRAGFKAGITFFLGKPVDVNQLAGLFKPLRGAMLREKRSYVRLPIRTVVTCKTERKQFTSASRNISEGGILVENSGGLEIGQEVQLSFSVPQVPATVNVHGKVVRKEGSDRIAIQFVAVSPEDQKVIREYIAGLVRD